MGNFLDVLDRNIIQGKCCALRRSAQFTWLNFSKGTLILLVLWLYWFSGSWVVAQPLSFTVTGEVDLFANPGGSQIGKLIAGKELTFTLMTEAQSDGKAWVKIPLEGWIQKASTTPKTGSGSNIRVTKKKENLLVAPNKAVLATISQGTEMEVLEVNKNWLKMRLLGWLPTAQTNLPNQPQTNTTDHISSSTGDSLSSESQQKIAPTSDKVEKLPATLEGLTLQGEKVESILKLLKNLEEKLIPLVNLENQIKRQSEQQGTDTQSILEQLQKVKEKLEPQRGTTLGEPITLFSGGYFTPLMGISILGTMLVMGFMLWWLLYHRLSKLSGFSQFSEINQRLVHNTETLQSLNTLTIRGLEESKGAIGLVVERNSGELREQLLKQLGEMTQEMNFSFAGLNEKVVSDLGSIQTNLASNLGLLAQNQNRYFVDFNEKIIGTLTEMQQTVARSISMLSEKILNELGEMRTHFVSSTAESAQSQTKAMGDFRQQMIDSVESSLKRSVDMLNSMFGELRNTTEKHLHLMNERVEERLTKGFERNNEVFLNVIERLQQIDQAQQRISDLSNNVVSLQKTLDSKGARGAFGEVQLVELVRDAFPEKYIKFQHIMSNGKRPDCLLLLPPPTGNVAIDAKFPLENYLVMVNKEFTDQERGNASKNFKRDIKKHIVDISDKYIIPGETAQGAVMFIPSEAIFAEIHAYHPDLVQEAQNRRVWITSPTTLMAVLTTARAVLADAERNKQAKIIHEHLIGLSIEFSRFTKRMDELSRHIGQANTDVEQINITARKITGKFAKIEKVEIEAPVAPLISNDESLIE